MTSTGPTTSFPAKIAGAYNVCLRGIVCLFAVLAALSIAAMMLVTCFDVVVGVLNRFGWCEWSFVGALDIVKLAGGVTIISALPYTTAVKGHVAVEYFFHKMSRRGRIIIDVIVRLLGMGLFGCLVWRNIIYGAMLKENGVVSMTLQLPVFWLPYLAAFSFGVMVLVILYNMTHPGREMIKP
ncbi:MAG: TRAP transporter small permease [Sedimentisphaerales bacterium]|nr:TRAP transporter small permease [Sedimentisphaerales bacterium]